MHMGSQVFRQQSHLLPFPLKIGELGKDLILIPPEILRRIINFALNIERILQGSCMVANSN